MNSCEFVERREWGSMVAQLQYSSTKPKWSLKNDGDSSCSRDQKSLYVPVIIGHRRRRKDITSVTSFNLVVEVQGILYGLRTFLKELILRLALFSLKDIFFPQAYLWWSNLEWLFIFHPIHIRIHCSMYLVWSVQGFW